MNRPGKARKMPLTRQLGSMVLALGLLAHAEAVGAAASPSGAANSAFVQTNSQSQTLHLTVGHSLFLNTSTRLSRVYISNPVVLGSFTSSPNEVLVTAKAPGVSSLVIWDAFGGSSVYAISADIDVDGLRGEIGAALPGDHIEVSALQERISLDGKVLSQAEGDEAVKLAQTYAKDIANGLIIAPPHEKQVRLKVRIVEVDRTKLAQFGINFLSGGKNASSISTGEFSSFGGTSVGNTTPAANGITVSNPLNLFFYNQEFNVGLAISDLQQKQVLQILAEPTITAISGEKASFLSGGEFPFPVVQGGAGALASVTVQFRPYGVKLDFTPIVNFDGTIRLHVAPEVSALDYTNEVVISGYTIPAISTRRAETDVELKDGQSFAISGLLDRRLTDAFNRMPGFASIPILGEFFRSKSTTASEVELMVIVTPTVVDPLTNASPPVEPPMALPNLDPKTFDQQLIGNKKKQQQQQEQPEPQWQPEPQSQPQPQSQRSQALSQPEPQ
jgi:pilus assembly protein CpaC